MSRIYDALLSARESRSKAGPNASDMLGEMELPERRATPRNEVDIDLTVYGRGARGEVFYEQAFAVSGNASGGVFLLGIPVSEGQDLLLINNGSATEQTCRVVSVRIRDIQSSEVSVSFPVPNSAFWHCPKPAPNA
jgi:hypothetical protein